MSQSSELLSLLLESGVSSSSLFPSSFTATARFGENIFRSKKTFVSPINVIVPAIPANSAMLTESSISSMSLAPAKSCRAERRSSWVPPIMIANIELY